MLTGKSVLLIIGGGIAAYKCLDLIRRLTAHGVGVRCVLTRAGAEFVTPLSVSALSGEKVFSDLFSLTDEAEMGHIRLSREADLVLVAPATADLMGKMATGRADDLASTVLLAANKDVMIAPAMNVRMWEHPATRRNLVTLKGDGVLVVGPNEGDMACGEFGPGRMAEPDEILAAVESYFEAGAPGGEAGGKVGEKTGRPLNGRRAIVTSGPTHEAIDPVRYIANRSSGKQGHAIAAALSALGADVVLVSGPVNQPDPQGVDVVRVESAMEMMAAVHAALPADIAVCAAAVSDWRVAEVEGQKIKKNKAAPPPSLELTENPDILATLSTGDVPRPALVVGFAAETENLRENARAKLARKGCDWIVANDVGTGTDTFGAADNQVWLVDRDHEEEWPRMSKVEVGSRLARAIADYFADKTGAGK